MTDTDRELMHADRVWADRCLALIREMERLLEEIERLKRLVGHLQYRLKKTTEALDDFTDAKRYLRENYIASFEDPSP